jgi:hypothetical protein
MLTFDAVVDAIGQIEAKRSPGNGGENLDSNAAKNTARAAAQ